MKATDVETEFVSLEIALLTVSDTRTIEEDTSGKYLMDAIETAGHRCYERLLLQDEIYEVRAQVAQWIAESECQVIIITGGTGLAERDITPEAIKPLFDREIPGFGEVFRVISIQEVGTSTLQSRAIAGISNDTLIFALPGSSNACRTAWQSILVEQLDARHRPCNFVGLLR